MHQQRPLLADFPPGCTASVSAAWAAASGARADSASGGRPCGGVESLQPDKEARMPVARVVTFEGVSKDRMEEMRREMNEGGRPENVPATEIVVLHDPEAEKSVVILFFDTDEDYNRGDEALSAMQASETPGRRTSVTKYDVASRMTA